MEGYGVMKSCKNLLVGGECSLSKLARAAPVFVLLGIATHPASAQEAPPRIVPLSIYDSEIEVLLTPYLWTPWTSVDVHPSVAALPGLPSVSRTVDPGRLISHVTWIPFMGAAEFRSGSYGVILDYIHLPLTGTIDTHGILFGAGRAGLTEDTGTALLAYRAFSGAGQYLDIAAGVRAWGIGGSISLNPGLLPAVSVTRGGAWADGLVAIRYHLDLGNGFGATGYGDVGAGGADLDWQVVATLDYSTAYGVDLHAGFRSLNFAYDSRLARFNTYTYGPVVSATFHFAP